MHRRGTRLVRSVSERLWVNRVTPDHPGREHISLDRKPVSAVGTHLHQGAVELHVQYDQIRPSSELMAKKTHGLQVQVFISLRDERRD